MLPFGAADPRAQGLGRYAVLVGHHRHGDGLLLASHLSGSDLLDDYPTLRAYGARCAARPAFQRAMAAQIEGFARAA